MPEILVPGRVNLIGEHIDYHNLSVLPMAVPRRVRLAYEPRNDRRIRAVSHDGFGVREFELAPVLQPSPGGDWENYLKAAANAVAGRWTVERGIDAEISADLPPAAGLSSSSALLVAVTLALLRANGIEPTFGELMDVLPEGEHFVGTRGGGMDHAAVLASRAGHASLIGFAPPSVQHVPMPADSALLVAHSMTLAEKSGALRDEYNVRKTMGLNGLRRLGFVSFREAIGFVSSKDGDRIEDRRERECFRHVITEAARVDRAVRAMRHGDAEEFGFVLYEGHRSLRDDLQVSSPALDGLVEAARASGALGARLSGAGFGGCAVVFCRAADREAVRAGLIDRFYRHRNGFVLHDHLIDAEPSAGALNPTAA